MTTLAERSCFSPRIGRNRDFQAAVVGLDPVVGVLLGPMPRDRQQFVHHDRVGRGSAVTTSTGATVVVPIACSKNWRAAWTSLRGAGPRRSLDSS